jgi:hypothetical protein
LAPANFPARVGVHFLGHSNAEHRCAHLQEHAAANKPSPSTRTLTTANAVWAVSGSFDCSPPPFGEPGTNGDATDRLCGRPTRHAGAS